MQSRQYVTIRTISLGHWGLAQLQQARGDGMTALATLDALSELLVRRHVTAAWRARVAAMQAQLRLAQGDLAAAIMWAEGCGLSATDPLYEPGPRGGRPRLRGSLLVIYTHGAGRPLRHGRRISNVAAKPRG